MPKVNAPSEQLRNLLQNKLLQNAVSVQLVLRGDIMFYVVVVVSDLEYT